MFIRRFPTPFHFSQIDEVSCWLSLSGPSKEMRTSLSRLFSFNEHLNFETNNFITEKPLSTLAVDGGINNDILNNRIVCGKRHKHPALHMAA